MIGIEHEDFVKFYHLAGFDVKSDQLVSFFTVSPEASDFASAKIAQLIFVHFFHLT
jgi:hypothetical protein